jgi:translation initiation factor RLI1
MELGSIVSFELTDEHTQYSFPTFYYPLSGKRYYFKPLSLEPGSINFVIGERGVGKTLFLRSLTGLEFPKEKPLERNFLRYDIVYKPEFIEPKFTGNLKELIISRNLNENPNFMNNLKELGLNSFLDNLVKSLSEENKQLLSFLMFLSTEGLIYIMDCPSYLISKEKRYKMLNIFKKYCEKNDKIGLITEDDEEMIDKFFDSEIDKKYYIKKFAENEFYGGDMNID